MRNPLAPLSLDLDNKWSYLKTHGDDAWQTFPSYFETVVPRALDSLTTLGVSVTFFVVGKDAAMPGNEDLLSEVVSRGHEIGSHSFMHEPWLHLYDDETLRSELASAHEAIHSAVGVEPAGFRGPGFSLSRSVLQTLSDLGYSYDATVFPNLLNPVGRLYFFMRSNLTREERKQRAALFGTVRDSTQPNVPFRWRFDNGVLDEIPVTTLPGLRIPFHFSYLIYLSKYSETLAITYLRLALRLCKLRGVAPSLLLHPLDYLGVEDEPDLGFFPGMDMPRSRKVELTQRFLVELRRHYEIVPMRDYLESLNGLRTESLERLSR